MSYKHLKHIQHRHHKLDMINRYAKHNIYVNNNKLYLNKVKFQNMI